MARFTFFPNRRLLKEVLFQLQINNEKLYNMANSVSELLDKLSLLQEKLDKEQLEVKAALDKLVALNEDLKTQITDGGTPEQRQAASDKIDSIIADLEGTIPDEEV